MNTASFEIIRNILMTLLRIDIQKTDGQRASRHISYNPAVDKKGRITKEILKINNWAAVTKEGHKNLNGSCAFTVNIYRTTSLILINGPDASKFMDIFLPAMQAVVWDQIDVIAAPNQLISTILGSHLSGLQINQSGRQSDKPGKKAKNNTSQKSTTQKNLPPTTSAIEGTPFSLPAPVNTPQ